MANIILVGFQKPKAEELREQIEALMEKHGWATPGEAATIILDVETRWCGSKEPAPYLVVQHSKSHIAEAIGTALHTAFNLDTQIEVTHKYLASVPSKCVFPSRPKNANVTLAQIKSMFVGKRLRITDSVQSELNGSTGVCKDVFGSGSDFQVQMDMAFKEQREYTIFFHVETITSTFVEGPIHIHPDNGGRSRRMIEIIG